MAQPQVIKLDVTPEKPSYQALVERLTLVSNFLENVGNGLVENHTRKAQRENTALMLKREARDVRLTVALAKHGK